MYRRTIPLLVVVGMTLGLGVAFSREPTSSGSDRTPIREFDVDTAARLGREIYQRDQYAWVATDVLMALVSRKQLEAEQVTGGWVVDTSGQEPLVRFLRKRGDGLEAAYDIHFPKGGKPGLVIPDHRELTSDQVAQAQAVKTANQALHEGKHPWCGGAFNPVVLTDPERSGLLVYMLRAKPSADEIPVGGHYRISVSSDGKTLMQVDQLFASCLTLSKQPPKEKGAGDVAMLVMSHIVSAQPLETHVFLSLQDHVPFSVVTPDGAVWMVDGGKITATKFNVRDESTTQ